MRFLPSLALSIAAFGACAQGVAAAQRAAWPLHRAAVAGSVTLFPFVPTGNNVLGPLAFAPDGTAFFVDAPSELVRFNVVYDQRPLRDFGA